MEKNYEDINTTVSFSVLRCFRSTGYLLRVIAHERMYLLSINTKEGGTQNTKQNTYDTLDSKASRVRASTTFKSCSLVVYIFLVNRFSFVILAISNYF